MNYMYVANTSNFQQKISLQTMLRLVNTFTTETDKYYPRCYKVNYGKTFKNLVYYVSFVLTKHHMYIYCRLARLKRTFENHIYSMLCIIGSGQKGIKLYALDPFHLRRASKLSKFLKEDLLILNSETTQNLNIYLYNYQTKIAIFIGAKHKKTIMAYSYLNFYKCFLHFELLANNTTKNESIHLNFWH